MTSSGRTKSNESIECFSTPIEWTCGKYDRDRVEAYAAAAMEPIGKRLEPEIKAELHDLLICLFNNAMVEAMRRVRGTANK